MSERIKTILENLTPEQRALVERRMLAKRPVESGSSSIPRRSDLRRAPMSFAQQRMWFLEQLTPGNPAHHIADAFLIEGDLDVAVLRRSLNELVKRHESLRTTFTVVEGEPVQVIADTLEIDLTEARISVAAAGDDAAVQDVLVEESGRAFDLENGPLVRAKLVHVGDRTRVLVLTVHHIVSDAWSREIFLRELVELYGAFREHRTNPLLELPIQYGDFAAWQRDRLAGERLDRQMEFWKRQLAGLPTLQLPVDHPRPAVPGHRGGRARRAFSARVTRAVRDLCREEGVTVYMLMLAALDVLLKHYGGQDDVVVGTPVAGRNREEVEGVIGFFVNMLVMRTDLADDPNFRTLVARARDVAVGAQEHQDLPFEKLVEELDPLRDMSRSPLFQVAYQYLKIEDAPDRSSVLPMRPVKLDLETTRFDLEVHAWERGEDLGVVFVYRTDLFEASTVERMVTHFEALLDGLVSAPDRRISEVPLLSGDERRRVLVEWNDTAHPFPDDHAIQEVFEEQVRQTPDADAAVFEGERWTYRELNRRANRIAHFLAGKDVGPDVLVGICAERSLDMVAGILGILKAGGAYVPLDPGYPRERLAFMLRDSGAALVLTQEHLLPDLPEHHAEVVCLDRDRAAMAGHPETDPPRTVDPDNLAYVIYTSGSTGTPKGTLLPHRGLCNLSQEQGTAFGVGPGTRVLQFSSLSFDASTFDLMMALPKGGTLFLGRRESIMPGPDLLHFLRRHAIQIVTLPPTALASIPVEDLPDLKTITVAGEACSAELVARWAPGRKFFNLYGPTEATIWSTTARLEAGGEAPHIGRPVGNTRVYVLDDHFQPVPVGVPGELHIGGVGLARGYHNRPDLTAERFVPDTFSDRPGERLYRTGDLVRYQSSGNVEFLGRIDHQVKLRGFRIEPGEIEAALVEHAAVGEAAVLCREDSPGDKELVAYVVGAGDADVSPADLKRHLAETLPEYMLPAAFVVLESMPVNPNGKLDRNALPPPSRDRQAAEAYVAPRSELEQKVAEIWREVLGVEQVGVKDNFFDLGGHSLRLVQVHGRLQTELGRDLSVTDLFRYPTIESIVEALTREPEEGTSHSLQGEALSRIRKSRSSENNAVAVIGMAGRFPGAPDVEAFWSNLLAGEEGIRFFTDDELREAGVSEALLAHPDYVKARAVLDAADRFDARLFGYTPREAELIDPQQRVFLECAWEALERAGCDPERYHGMIGVYAGASLNTYLLNILSHPTLLAAGGGLSAVISNDKDFLPTRVSYKLNLRGPSMNVQTACSTSLVAVHEAYRSLLDYQCDVALAGGVAVSVPSVAGYMYQEGGIQSPDGHCRAFDARANGMLRGDGVGIVVLKRLDEAIRDGDEVHAVVRGTAINNDGSFKVGYTAPSVQGQAEVIALAQAFAGVDPETVSYVEAHGTGTALGDPIEVAALTRVFRESTEATGFCGLGSLKTNIGHLDAAAGVAGVIKTVLALKHRKLPPSLHFEHPNPEIDFENGPFYVVTECRDWETTENHPRRAGVSSFGLGGTNAHAVLEEAPTLEPSDPSRPWQLLVLSAKSSAALDTMTATLAGWLRRQEDVCLADVAHTLQIGRRELEHRRAVVCRDVPDAIDALDGGGPDRSWKSHARATQRPVVFLFPGQGAQYVNMGLGLYDDEPAFRDAVDECLGILETTAGLDFRSVLYPVGGASEESSARLMQTEVTQPALFVVEYALSRLWRSWGIEPESCIGHSIGEFVAACVSGVLALDDALRLVAERGRLMGSMPKGVMVAVPLPEDRVAEVISGEEGLWLSTVNAPSMCVVSGTAGRVESFEARMSSEGVECRRLHTSHAFHSGLMDDAVAPFVEAVREVTLHAPRIPYMSNVTGDWVTAELVQDPNYWGRQIRMAVCFADGMERLLSDPKRALLEVGPGQVLGSLAKRHEACGRDRVVVSSLRQPRADVPDTAFLMGALGRLWSGGVQVNWSRLREGERRRRVTLPTYPFDRERYWIEQRRKDAVRPVAGRRPDLADWFYAPVWRRTRVEEPDTQGPHGTARSATVSDARPTSILIFANGADFDRRVVERLEETGRPVVIVRVGGSFREAEGEYQIDPSEGEDYVRLLGRLRNSVGVPGEIVHLWSASFESQRPSRQRAGQIQAHGFYSLLHLARALGSLEILDSLRITVVTHGVHGVTGDEAIQPEEAMVLGFCRTAPLEMPNLSCRNVDLSIDAGAEQTEPAQRDVDRLVGELLSAADEPMVAIRRGHRWVQSFVRTGLDAVSDGGPRRLRPQGTYLIAGGMGGMGLVLAAALAHSVQARLVLTCRSPFPARDEWARLLDRLDVEDPLAKKIRAIQTMEAAGAAVMVAQADVTDLDGMREVVSAAEKRFGPIRGVMHLAGVPGGEMIARAEPDFVGRTLAPKVEGARVLERLFGSAELDFMLISSSLVTSWSVPGFVDYCAASAFLDAFARRFAADTDTFTVAIDWPRWSEAGMAVEFARAHGGSTEIQGITSAEGVEVLRRVLDGCDEAQILVSEVDFRESLAALAATTAGAARPSGLDDDAPEARGLRERPELSAKFLAPRDDAEQTLARIWQSLFGIERIGIHDDFFELGGDSVLSIQLAARAKEAGIPLTTKNVMELPTISQLAETVEHAALGASAGDEVQQPPVVGDVPLTPIQQWFLELDLEGADHFNHAVLLVARCALTVAQWEALVRALLDHHDALRLRVVRQGSGWRQVNAEPSREVPFTIIDVSSELEGQRAAAIEARAAEIQASLDLAKGPIVRFVLFDLGPDEVPRLLVVVHHMAIDAVSWPILLEDLARLVDQQSRGVPLELAAKTTSFQEWARRLYEHALSPAVAAEAEYWRSLPWSRVAPLPVDTAGVDNTVGDCVTVSVTLDETETRRLLEQVPRAYRMRVDEILLTALVGAFEPWTARSTVLVDLEGHGREPLFDDVDLTRTVGWFTSMYPVVLDTGGMHDPGMALKRVKEQARSVPARGIGYGLLRYLHPDQSIVDELRSFPASEVSFLYLGQRAATAGDGEQGTLVPAREATGAERSPRSRRAHLFEIISGVGAGRLRVQWTYSTRVHRKETVEALAERFIQSLRELIEHCSSGQARGYTPSDFPYAEVDQDELDRIEARYGADDIEDLYALSPMQQGMLFHRLQEPASGMYMEQKRLYLEGLDPDAFRRAWERVVARHTALRTSIVLLDSDRPVQVVHRHVPLLFTEHDLRGMPEAEMASWIDGFADAERRRGFDADDPSRMRLALIRVGDNAFEFIFTVEHLIIDGWSKPLVMGEVFGFYRLEKEGIAYEPGPVRPYRDYIAWLHDQDPADAEAYWRRELGDFEAPTLVGRSVEKDSVDGEPEIVESRRTLPEEVSKRLKTVAAEGQVTLNTVVLGAWSLVIGRHLGSDDLVLGTPVLGRPPDLPGVESIAGLCLNTVPLRVQIDGDATLLSWLRSLHSQQVERSRFEYAPLWEVQRWSRVPAGTPLFDNLFVFQNAPRESSQRVREGGVSLYERPFVAHVSYPVMLDVYPANQLQFRLTCDLAVIDEDSMGRLLDHLVTVLRGFASDPQQRLGDISLLDAAEREQIVVAWNDTRREFPEDLCLHHLVEAQARRTPDAPAIVHQERVLTYTELNARANHVAHALRSRGVRPQMLVGLCIERGPEMIVGVLGILKAGAAYVPLDPAFPSDRLAFMLADAEVSVIVTTEGTATDVPAVAAFRDNAAGILLCLDEDEAAILSNPATNPEWDVTADQLAYVMYTSGSTGRPKGVEIQHRSVVNFLESMRREPGLGTGDVLLAVTTLSFDISVLEVCLPLGSGARVVIASSAEASDGYALQRKLADAGVTVMQATPATWQMLLHAGWPGDPELKMLCGGEALPRRLADALLDLGGELWNMYGPTETTIWSAVSRVERGAGSVTLGRPVANTTFYVLDREHRPVPIGVAGELYIGGAGVARGYRNRSDLTAERFMVNPFSDTPGDRVYRTGDLVRYRPDGTLEFLGRIDNQVKLRGYRIELGEIEAALAAHPWVRDVAVTLREDREGDHRLVGYVVPTRESEEAEAQTRSLELAPELRRWLEERLPDYMVPSSLVALDALPLTANGKLDRRALASAEYAPPEQRTARIAPRSAEEEILCEIWKDVLGVSTPGVHDNFFELGGHSLKATQLVSRIRDTVRVELPVRAVFDHPTVATLASRLGADSDDQAPAKPAIVPVPREDRMALSYGQYRLWVLDQMGTGSAYNIYWTFLLEGALDADALQRAVNAIVQRHEVLRTRFPRDDGEPRQEILPELEIPLEVVDLSLRSPEAQPAELASVCAEFGARRFDLVGGPLLRAAVLRLGEARHVVALSVHHIVFDGWSIGVLNRELAAHYRAFLAGEEPQVPSLQVQYADFAHWQREWLSGDVYEGHLAFWREQLQGAPVLELPTDRRRAAVQTYDGAFESFQVPATLARDVKALGRRHGATLTMTLMAAFKTLLYRYTGQDDIVIGSPIANRNYREIEDLLGFFVNSLVMRTDLSGDPSFKDLLRRVKDVALEAFEHQDFPFDRLVDELQPERDPSRNPLFQVMFALQNAPEGELSLPDVSVSGVAPSSTATRFDIEVHLSEWRESVSGVFCYSTALFDAKTIRRMIEHFRRVLESVVANPDLPLSALPLLATEEHDRIVHGWNETTTDYPRRATVAELFEGQAERVPERIAVSYGDRQLTYGVLNRRANQVAHLLRELGVGPNVMVGICAERGVEMVVGILGIIKAGGAYVPLAADYPAQRLEFMLEDTRAPVLLVQRELRELVSAAYEGHLIDLDIDAAEIAKQPDTNVSSGAESDDVAYVMYTSGSTGQPKGIRVPHRAITRLVLNTDYVDLNGSDRIAQASNASFDAATFEIWGALLNGAQVVGVSKDEALSPTAFRAAIRERGITTLFVTTALFNQLSLEAPDIFAPLRYLLFGGEAVDPNRVRDVLETGRPEHLLHVYGPTENTTFSTWHEVRSVAADATTVPIGRPIANTTAYVLDAGQRPVPVGVPGELYLGGDGLALGYFEREALNRERFVAHPFAGNAGARLYRTGDVVRYRRDGAIEFMGRIDHQVKLRGFRIELGEIESVLEQHAEIDHAVALVREDRPGNRRLVAYMVPKGGASLSTPEVQGFLKDRLPAYMVPSALLQLDSLPLTPNGKVDRSALPDPDPTASAQPYEAPRSRIEQELAGIWSSVLGVETIGVHDNFFELGGDSILSIQLVARANDAGLRITARQLMQRQTIAELAQAVGEGAQVTAEQGPVTGDVPLTPIQRWFFEQDLRDPHHFNQSTLFAVRRRTSATIFREAIRSVLEHHDALRLRYERRDNEWRQRNAPPDNEVPLIEIDLTDRSGPEQLETIRSESEKLQQSLMLDEGPLLRAALFDLGDDAGQRLLVVIHHLAVDGVSWRILGEDLQRACESLRGGEPVELPPKTTSFRDWARRIETYAQGDDLEEELDHWLGQPWSDVGSVHPDRDGGDNTGQAVERVTASLNESETSALLQEVPEAYNTQINDVLLTALATAIASWTGRDAVLIDLEGHGREDLFDDVDVSRTVGWFTTMFPVVLDLRECGAAGGWDPGTALKSVKEQLRSIPGRGIGYGLARYMSPDPPRTELLARLPQAQVSFNYLGQLDQMFNVESIFGLGSEPTESPVSPRNRRAHLLDVGASIQGGRLQVNLTLRAAVFDRTTMDRFMARFMESLRELISHCRLKIDRDYTPSDFPMADLDEDEFKQVSDLLEQLDPTD